MNKGSVQIFFWGWLADYPDAENFLFMLYGPNSKALTDGNGENNANYQNPEFDKLFEKMKFLEDGPEKQKLIDQMIEIVQNDAVWSFGYFPTSAAAYHQWISNGKPTQIVRNHIGYLRLDPELRARKIAEWNQPVWWPIPLIALVLVARHRAGVVRLAPARARDRRAHAGGRGRRAVINYILRRIGYGVLILIGVNLFTFLLFFTVNTPDDMARMNIGGKRVTQDAIEKWKVERGYDKPLFWNAQGGGRAEAHEHDLRRALGAALRVRLRRVRQRARHRLRAEAPRGAVDRARDPDVHPRHLRRDRVLAAARVLPQHLPRVLGRHAGRVPAVDLVAVLHHRRAVLLQQAPEARADLRLRGRRRSRSYSSRCRSSSASPRGWAARRSSTARCSSRRSARTTCAPRAPRASPRPSCCSATCCAMRCCRSSPAPSPCCRCCSWARSSWNRSSASRASAATRSTRSTRRTSRSCARWCSSARCSTSSASS